MQLGACTRLFRHLGNVLGLFVLADCATLGLGAVVKDSAVLFTIIKAAGAAYLIYLGIKQWLSKSNIFRKPISDDESVSKPPGSLNRTTFFRDGFTLVVTNPKPLLFFAALYPQFLNFHEPLVPQFLIMTFTFMAISFVSLPTYAMLAGRAMAWFTHGNRATYFNRGSGAAFVFLGMSMLLLKRPGT